MAAHSQIPANSPQKMTDVTDLDEKINSTVQNNVTVQHKSPAEALHFRFCTPDDL